MSLRLSAALRTSPEFWLRMQVQHDLWRAQRAGRPRVRPFPRATKKKQLAFA
jgi:plasmid maintenance system antidote protein VapI